MILNTDIQILNTDIDTDIEMIRKGVAKLRKVGREGERCKWMKR